MLPIRRFRTVGFHLTFACLFLCLARVSAQEPWFQPIAKKSMTKEQKKRIARRKREYAAVSSYYGKDIDRAMRLSAQLIKRDLEVFGAVHDESARSRVWVAGTCWRKENFKLTLDLYKEAGEVYAEIYGKDNWRWTSSVYYHNLRVPIAGQGRKHLRDHFGDAWTAMDQAWDLTGKDQNVKGIAAAEKALRLFKQTFEGVLKPPMGNIEYSQALQAMARGNRNLGRYAKAETLIRDALKLVDAAYGRSHPVYADRLRDLGIVHRNKGEYAQAELAFRECVEILDKCYDGPHRDKATLYADLGRTYQDQRQYARSEELYRKGMETWKASDEAWPNTYSTCLEGVAYSLYALNKLDEAEPLLEENVEYCKKKFGAGTTNTAVALNSLAHLQIKRKNFKDALGNYTTSANIYAKKFGKKNRDYAVVTLGMARCQGELKQYAKAEQNLRDALATLAKKLGAAHHLTVDAHDKLCELFGLMADRRVKAEKFEAAREAAEKKVAARVEFYGDKHWSVFAAKADLAYLETLEKKSPEEREKILEASKLFAEATDLRAEGKYADALPLLDKAVALRKEHVGAENASTADAMMRLAHTCHQLGRTVEAEKLYRTAGLIYEKIWPAAYLPPSHAEGCAQIASYCKKRGDLAQAVRLYDIAREQYRRLFGDSDNDYANALLESGRLRVTLGDVQQAEVMFRELVDLRLKYVGKDSPAYAVALEELATVLRLTSKPEQAEPLLLEALERTKPEAGHVRADNIRIRNQVGLFYRHNRKPAQAAAHFQQCLDEYRYLNTDDENYATYLNNLGAVLLETGQAAKAEPHLRQALDIFARLNMARDRTLPRVVRILEDRARALLLADEGKRAAAAQAEAVALLEKHAGGTHWRTTLAKARKAALESAIELPAEKKQKFRQADAAGGEAATLIQDGRFAEAFPLAQRAVDSRKEAVGSANLDLAADLYRLAVVMERLGRNQDSARALERALEIRTGLLGPNHPETAALIDAAGQLALRGSDYRKAEIQFAKAAVALSAVTGTRSVETANSLGRQGVAILRQGEFVRAEQPIRTAHEILRVVQGDNMLDFCQTTQGLAEWFTAVGDIDRATALLEQTEARAKRYLVDSTAALAGNLHVQAILAKSRKELVQAESLARRAADLTRQVYGESSTAHAATQAVVADILGILGKNEQAETLLFQAMGTFEKALGEGHPAIAGLLHSLGVVQGNKAEFAKAEGIMLKALELQKKQGTNTGLAYAETLRDLGALMHQMGAPERAAGYYRQFLEHCRGRLQNVAAVQTERQQIALTRQLRGALDCVLSLPIKPAEVEDVYAHVIAWKGAAFARYESLRHARSKPELAPLFEKWERLTHRLATQATRIPYLEEQALWYQRVEQMTRERERLERQLFRRALGNAPVKMTTPQDLRKVLPPGTVLLDFLEYERRIPQSRQPGRWDAERHLAAFVVARGKPVRRIELGPVQNYDGVIRDWRTASLSFDKLIGALVRTRPGKEKDKLKAEAEELEKRINIADLHLSRIIWEPLSDAVSDADMILAAPDGQLTLFPLTALLVGRNRYLVEDKGVAVVPVPATLPQFLADRPSDSSAPSLLAMGGIDFSTATEKIKEDKPSLGDQTLGSSAFVGATAFNRDSITQLRLTGPEVISIAKLFQEALPGSSVKVFLGRKASEGALRENLASSRWLYISTHGFFSNTLVRNAMTRIGGLASTQSRSWASNQAAVGTPSVLADPALMSGLTLAGANEANSSEHDDGVLWAMEVAGLNLSHVDLAVLSACQTAEGEVNSGEGVFGLQRAFHAAGTRSVISTLWPVNEFSCKLLMERFAANVLRKKMTKLEALREAQLWMLTAARRFDNNNQPRNITFESESLPPWLKLPTAWSGFVLSGEWR